MHNDDISNVLILNKKSIANHENKLFQAELEKFRSHQNRLVSTVHKQSSLLKELTKTFGDLLQDKRVRADQQKYEAIQRSRNNMMKKYRQVFGAHEDLIQGLMRAQSFYSEMKDSVVSLEKNVESFVNNRRAEGAQLLNQIEQHKSSASSGQAVAERERLQQLMERMSMEPSPSSPNAKLRLPTMPTQLSYKSPPISPQYPATNPDPRFTIPPRHSPAPVTQAVSPPQVTAPNGYQHPGQQLPAIVTSSSQGFAQGAAAPLSTGYNPMAYPFHGPISPPVHQNPPQNYFTPTMQNLQSPSFSSQQPPQNAPVRQLSFTAPSPQGQQSQHHQWQYNQQQPYNLPSGYVPPPPPPGPPGGSSTTQYPPSTGAPHASGPGGYAQSGHRPYPPQPNADPWAGLSAWK